MPRNACTVQRLWPVGEYHLRNTTHDFYLVCFAARRCNVHVLFLQRPVQMRKDKLHATSNPSLD